MKLLLCFGTRPEAIKMAPVIFELRKRKIPHKICITAQHREMLDQVLDFFHIKPDYDLDLMVKGQTLNSLSGKILEKINPVLELEGPDIVLVQGDTTTAAIISLAAFHLKIKVGHVEAGLRTYNPQGPFPEEINRQITARIADLHFSPTPEAAKNLIKENIAENKIFVTGNTIVDAILWSLQNLPLHASSKKMEKIEEIIRSNKKVILVTGHRRESFGQGLAEICEALVELSLLKGVALIYPVHLNPSVKNLVHELLGNKKNIHLMDPLPYPQMLYIMQNCDLIISDSGGIQEEAPTFKKPILVTRDESERMEGINAGFSHLVGTNKNVIVPTATKLLETPPDFLKTENPFGDGKASEKIVDILLSHF